MSDFNKFIKPYYDIIESTQCYCIYSPDKQGSIQGAFYQFFTPKAAKELGFKLLCEDLFKSVRSATKYVFDNNLDYKLPVESYEILENTRDALIVHKLSEKTGYGILSGGPLEKGTFVAEYIGEKIPSQHQTIDTTYVFLTEDSTYIDAQNYGNIARFINHCPNNHVNKDVMTANLAAILLPVSENINKMFFITLRDIKEFEPLCYDYGDKYIHEGAIELLNVNTYLPMNEHNDL